MTPIQHLKNLLKSTFFFKKGQSVLSHFIITTLLVTTLIPTAHAETQTQIIFHHTDHLGSSSISTDEEGNVIESTTYYPFGELHLNEENEAYQNPYKFTGKEQDPTGLYYYEARYYDPATGRFISQDPWEGDLTNPQSFNEYSYVFNNPLKYTDPTGEIPDPSDSIAGLCGPAFWACAIAKEIAEYAILRQAAKTAAKKLIEKNSTLEVAKKIDKDARNQALEKLKEKATSSGGGSSSGSEPPDFDEDDMIEGYHLSRHVQTRMEERGIKIQDVKNTIKRGESFTYWGNRTGFYDSKNNIFVGVGDRITTVIKPKSGKKYINNLKKHIK